MKFNKLFAYAVAALALTACTDGDSIDETQMLGKTINSNSGVVVNMQDAQMTVGENKSTFNVPIEVTGETNGKIVVTVAVKPGTANPNDPEHPTLPATDGVEYTVTSKTINIPAGETIGYVEVANIWEQGVINDDHVFDMYIVSAAGATVGNQKQTEVTIENVDDAYTMMAGAWTFTGTNAFGGAEEKFDITMKCLDADDPYYGTELDAFGLKGLNYVYLPFNFAYDKETNTITMSVYTGSFATISIINFTGLGQCIVASSTSGSGFGEDTPVTVSDDWNHLTVPEGSLFRLAVMPYPALNQILGTWDGWYDYKLDRKGAQ